MADNLEAGISIQSAPVDGESPTTVPAKWGDIALYLLGGFGSYLVLSLGVALIYAELNLTVTVLTTMLNFLCFVGGVYLLGVRRGKLTWDGIGLIPPKEFVFSLVGGAALAFLVNIFRILVVFGLVIAFDADLESLAGREEFFLIGLDTWYGVILNLVGIGVLVPIAEELFFRGLIYDWFRQKMPIWTAVLFSSLLFGLGHFDSWLVIVSTFIMGIALALAYEITRSIWISIFIHIFTNAGSVMLMAFFAGLEPALPGILW